ncbi:MAG: ornithine decarboxylase, partial [Silicimonas sp.]|nr:ornithine decarboxylase [Silicimonas sp.]
MNLQSAEKKLPSIGDYYSATQLRADRWSALRETAESLRIHGIEGRRGKALLTTAEALFDALEPIEIYWAFPGAQSFEHLRRLLDQRNIDDLSYSVRRVARALTSGAYRRRSIPIGGDEADNEDYEDESALAPEDRALGRPYFEVLIVDSVNEHQERFLRNNLHRARRAEDPFIYEPVIVPSLEDALMGILFNHNVQAVIVRPGLVLKSHNELPILKQFLNLIGDEEDVDALQPSDYGPEACRLIAKVRPELDAYLITDRSAEDIAGMDLGRCRRVFYNQEDFLELHLNILRGVNRRYKTPFFTALKEYSTQPTGVFHA